MQHFEYQQNKHKLQILKRLYIPLALFVLSGFYIAWTLNRFSTQELWLITRNGLVVFGPLLLLGVAFVALHYWSSQFRQRTFPTLSMKITCA